MKFLPTLILSLSILFLLVKAYQAQPDLQQQVSADINQQILCMAKNIYYEAAMEPHEGKLAVAQVTINRANHGGPFPKDFCGVVYQKTGQTCQFTWTCEKVGPVRNQYAWEECLYIAKRAIRESVLHRELAKARAMFYHATYVHPGWSNIRPVRTIGNHIFYTKA